MKICKNRLSNDWFWGLEYSLYISTKCIISRLLLRYFLHISNLHSRYIRLDYKQVQSPIFAPNRRRSVSRKKVALPRLLGLFYCMTLFTQHNLIIYRPCWLSCSSQAFASVWDPSTFLSFFLAYGVPPNPNFLSFPMWIRVNVGFRRISWSHLLLFVL